MGGAPVGERESFCACTRAARVCQRASGVEFLEFLELLELLELLAAMEVMEVMEVMEGMEGMEVMEGAGRSRSVRVPFYVTKSAHQVLITRTHSYTRFVGLVIGLVTGLSNTIARCAPTSRGRSSGWSFCACTRAARVCQRASSVEILAAMEGMEGMEGMDGRAR